MEPGVWLCKLLRLAYCSTAEDGLERLKALGMVAKVRTIERPGTWEDDMEYYYVVQVPSSHSGWNPQAYDSAGW